jgi:hypothetical protein
MDTDAILGDALPEPPSDAEIAELKGDEYEAAVRAKWGYTASETRTEAERHATADRIRAKTGPAVALRNGEVPHVFRPDPKPERKR